MERVVSQKKTLFFGNRDQKNVLKRSRAGEKECIGSEKMVSPLEDDEARERSRSRGMRAEKNYVRREPP